MQKDGSKIKVFSDLIAWQEGHALVTMIYRVTDTFPTEEKFSLTSQIRRAAVSVTSNIAEGFGRQQSKDKNHFYVMARGSLMELQNQLIIAKDIELLSREAYESLHSQSTKALKLLHGLIKSIDKN